MESRMTEEEIYREAQARVSAKSKFYKSLAAFIVINAGIFLIWYFVAGHGYPWFLWILGFWGLFLILDFFDTFVWQRKMGKSAIEKEAQKIRAGQ